MKLFVTGTDTGVGKTYVTSRLVMTLRARGWRVAGVKPVETGFVAGESDADALASASGRRTDESVAVTLALPRSPKAAAAAAGRPVDLDAVVRWVSGHAYEVLLVEGAGGWAVPITEKHRMRDLSAAVADQVLVVARAGLGTINHCLLTVEAILPTQPVLGVALSTRSEDDLAFAQDNAREITAQTGVRVAIVRDDVSEIAGWIEGDLIRSRR